MIAKQFIKKQDMSPYFNVTRKLSQRVILTNIKICIYTKNADNLSAENNILPKKRERVSPLNIAHMLNSLHKKLKYNSATFHLNACKISAN